MTITRLTDAEHQFSGFHSHVAAQDAPEDEPTRVHFEVFHWDGKPGSLASLEPDEHLVWDCDKNEPMPGWYWWACNPGCLPDGEPSGPFSTAEGAYLDAIGD